MLNLPHALAMSQTEQLLYVADRENFRTLSYSFLTGKFNRTYQENFNDRVFSITYASGNNYNSSGTFFLNYMFSIF